MTVLIVDAHTHVWDLARTPQPWIEPAAAPALERNFTLGELKNEASANHVNRTIIVQSVNQSMETEALLRDYRDDQFVGGIVGWTDLAHPSSVANINWLLNGAGGDRLCGFRHVFAPGELRAWLSSDEITVSLRHLADNGLPFDLLVRSEELPMATELVRTHPEVTFVLDHLAKPDVKRGGLEPWRTHILELSKAANVRAKLSGLPGEADWSHWSSATLQPFFDIAVEAFTPDRLIFATDWPVCTVAGTYTSICDAQLQLCQGLTEPELNRVLRENATTAYARARMG